jgi:hypothetical protein
MIGAIDEAKKKAPPIKAEAKPKSGAEPETKPAAKGTPKPAVDSKAKSEPQPMLAPKSKPEAEHAAADAHES